MVAGANDAGRSLDQARALTVLRPPRRHDRARVRASERQLVRKLWLEISEESNWPEPLPGPRPLYRGKGHTRKWKVLAKAIRRGRYKLGPIVLRSGDPFGLFPREARVPTEALLLVYPRVMQLPHWQLPGSVLEGGVLTGQRSLQSTSMVMGIREYRPGDAMNRIHWPSSVRHRGLQVKEFELDKTADLWIYLDLERHWHRGDGEDSTEERAVTVAASIVAKALREHRNVGMITSGTRAESFQPHRGTKQYGKLMQYSRRSPRRVAIDRQKRGRDNARFAGLCVRAHHAFARPGWVRPRARCARPHSDAGRHVGPSLRPTSATARAGTRCSASSPSRVWAPRISRRRVDHDLSVSGGQMQRRQAPSAPAVTRTAFELRLAAVGRGSKRSASLVFRPSSGDGCASRGGWFARCDLPIDESVYPLSAAAGRLGRDAGHFTWLVFSALLFAISSARQDGDAAREILARSSARSRSFSRRRSRPTSYPSATAS